MQSLHISVSVLNLIETVLLTSLFLCYLTGGFTERHPANR